jgi:Ribonuclease G/E
LFEREGIEEQIDRALQPKLSLPGGGSITIEETEALVAIDVDAPVRHPRDRLGVDLKAAEEIARQLRLRALGGLIVVDFLRLADRGERDRVSETMQAAVADDPMAVQVMGWTRSGLFEVIRPRSGPSLTERLTDRGERLKSAASVGLDALRALARTAAANPGRGLRLRASEEVLRWLAGPGRSSRAEAEARLGQPYESEAAPEMKRDRFEVTTR